MDTRRVVNMELQLLRRIGTGSGSAEEAVEKIKRRRGGSGLCYLVQMPTSTATFKSISGESTWGRLFYQIAACLGDVRRKKKNIFSKAEQVKLNGSVISLDSLSGIMLLFLLQ